CGSGRHDVSPPARSVARTGAQRQPAARTSTRGGALRRADNSNRRDRRDTQRRLERGSAPSALLARSGCRGLLANVALQRAAAQAPLRVSAISAVWKFVGEVSGPIGGRRRAPRLGRGPGRWRGTWAAARQGRAVGGMGSGGFASAPVCIIAVIGFGGLDPRLP